MFSDLLSVNTTSNEEGKLVLGYDTYALQLQDIDLSKFNGQTFFVNFRSVEDALALKGSIDSFLGTTVEIVDNATAALHIPKAVSESLDKCNDNMLPMGSFLSGNQQRLSYSVFLTDILFQSQNRSRFDIGSIVVSTRLRCAENSTLLNPITATFRTIKQVAKCT